MIVIISLLIVIMMVQWCVVVLALLDRDAHICFEESIKKQTVLMLLFCPLLTFVVWFINRYRSLK